MIRSFVCVGVAALLATSATAKAPCPAREAGAPYPWSSGDIRKDDTWAKFRIYLDAKGRPTDCRILEGNAEGDTRFFMCRALMAQGTFKPALENGVPVAGSVERVMVLPGRTARRADEIARKKFFRDHPEERPSCYPS